MTANFVVSFFQDAVALAAMLTLPAMGLGLLVGLAVSIFQAVTQIQEQTLALVPKIIAIVGALIVSGGWMLTHLVTYTQNVFEQMVQVAG